MYCISIQLSIYEYYKNFQYCSPRNWRGGVTGTGALVHGRVGIHPFLLLSPVAEPNPYNLLKRAFLLYFYSSSFLLYVLLLYVSARVKGYRKPDLLKAYIYIESSRLIQKKKKKYNVSELPFYKCHWPTLQIKKKYCIKILPENIYFKIIIEKRLNP